MRAGILSDSFLIFWQFGRHLVLTSRGANRASIPLKFASAQTQLTVANYPRLS